MMSDSIVHGLVYSLGKGGQMVIERTYDMKSISADPGKLHSVLESLFNGLGASVIERQIVRQLYDEIGERYVEAPEMSFEAHIEQAKKAYNSQRGRSR